MNCNHCFTLCKIKGEYGEEWLHGEIDDELLPGELAVDNLHISCFNDDLMMMNG